MSRTTGIDLKQIDLAKGEDLLPKSFPELVNPSAGFMFKFVVKPLQALPPEFVYIPIDVDKRRGKSGLIKVLLTVAEWNALWETGHLRPDIIHQLMAKDFPDKLRWLIEIKNANLYLLPSIEKSAFPAFEPLYHLLSLRTLERFGLPALIRGIWPCWMHKHTVYQHITRDFDDRVSKALANHLWPYLDSRSSLYAFSKDDPIVLLAHNLNFWLPCIYKVAEERLRGFPRVKFESKEQIHELRKLQAGLPPDVRADRPLCGGSIWCGEEEAHEATKQLVKVADEHGRLRAILDAVRSNRIEDDFSSLWSYAREDFERKMYHKRAKVHISFVQLDEAKPVHAPTSELHDDLLWEDFFALLDRKERRIVVCLKNGTTRIGEISKKLGYANHSPISKALKRIREKARGYLGL